MTVSLHGTPLESGVRGGCAVLAAVAVLAGSSSPCEIPFVSTLQSWHPEHAVVERGYALATWANMYGDVQLVFQHAFPGAQRSDPCTHSLCSEH